MDIEEFERRVQPLARRSKLEPFRAQILKLKEKGYADWQVRDWLAANGVEVSRQAVQLFVAKRTSRSAPDLDERKGSTDEASESAPASMAGKLLSETILEEPSKSYSFKQLTKAKESE